VDSREGRSDTFKICGKSATPFLRIVQESRVLKRISQVEHKLALHDRRAYFFVRQGGGRRDSKQDPRPPRLVSIPARGRLPKERRAVNLSCVQFGQLRCGVHNNVNHAGNVSCLSGANITKSILGPDALDRSGKSVPQLRGRNYVRR
jgi:hypothetical protein